MSAKGFFDGAVLCEGVGRLLEAQALYGQGIEFLTTEASNAQCEYTRNRLEHEMQKYREHKQKLEQRIENYRKTEQNAVHIRIEENSIGNSYGSLFSKYFTNDIQEVVIEEPYLNKNYQIHNLTSFLAVLIKHIGSYLYYVRVVTQRAPTNGQQFADTFEQIKKDLSGYKIKFDIQYDNNLHDRQIIFNNGLRIAIGRGLHFYKQGDIFGRRDYDLRQCLKTNVDIFHANKNSNNTITTTITNNNFADDDELEDPCCVIL